MSYADVNGLHMYYETHGEGSPLVLLHGGLGSGEMFGPRSIEACRSGIVPPWVKAGDERPSVRGESSSGACRTRSFSSGRRLCIIRPMGVSIVASKVMASFNLAYGRRAAPALLVGLGRAPSVAFVA